MLSLRLTVDSATYGRSHFLFPSPASLSLPRSPFISPFPAATYRRAKKNGPRRGLKSYHLYAALVSQPLISLLLPPSLSYSLSSISTGSLVRRSLDLGCEARGVRRTLGPGLLSLSLVAQWRCASCTAGRGGAHPPRQHAARHGSGGRQGAASAAARHAARHDVQQLFAAAPPGPIRLAAVFRNHPATGSGGGGKHTAAAAPPRAPPAPPLPDPPPWMRRGGAVRRLRRRGGGGAGQRRRGGGAPQVLIFFLSQNFFANFFYCKIFFS